jgi:hypothetical protein
MLMEASSTPSKPAAIQMVAALSTPNPSERTEKRRPVGSTAGGGPACPRYGRSVDR